MTGRLFSLREGGPFSLLKLGKWGLKEYKCLGYFGRPSTTNRLASWADSRAGSPVSQYTIFGFHLLNKEAGVANKQLYLE